MVEKEIVTHDFKKKRFFQKIVWIIRRVVVEHVVNKSLKKGKIKNVPLKP